MKNPEISAAKAPYLFAFSQNSPAIITGANCKIAVKEISPIFTIRLLFETYK